MKKSIVLFAVFIGICIFSVGAAAPWHENFYLGNDGWWSSRIPLEIKNNENKPLAGRNVTIPIGPGKGEVNIAGKSINSLRVCDAKGVELLYGVSGADGVLVRKGKIPKGGMLVIPLECPAKSQVTCYVYFDNPKAWAVDEYLRPSIIVTGFETDGDKLPAKWTTKYTDDKHKVSTEKKTGRSGSKALKTFVTDGAKPNWVGASFNNFPVREGTNYKFSAWTKGKNVKGDVGWFLHVRNKSGRFLINKVLKAGKGTFAWTKNSYSFTAPASAATVTIGTLLHGTGTAWYDDVSFTATTEPQKAPFTVTPGQIQHKKLKEDTQGLDWGTLGQEWDRAVPVLVRNSSSKALKNVVAYVDLKRILHGEYSKNRMSLIKNGKTLPYTLVKQYLMFEVDIPAETIARYTLVLAPPLKTATKTAASALPKDETAQNTLASEILSDQVYIERIAKEAVSSLKKWAQSPLNVVKQGSFEATSIAPWKTGAEGDIQNVTYTIEDGGVCGKRCAATRIPQNPNRVWLGWRQDVPVEPGKKYLFSAMVKCQNVLGRKIQIYAHLKRSDGSFTKDGNQYYQSRSGVSDSQGWTPLADFCQMPGDVTRFQIHLTTCSSGVVWHDCILLMPITEGSLGKVVKRQKSTASLELWKVNAVKKVFRTDLPPRNPEIAHISAARNELEPIQFAVRSTKDVDDVNIDVEAPVDTNGNKLSSYQTEVVGYVPVDVATSYYRSNKANWQRKVPSDTSRSDGWGGVMWPDPLLPQSSFDLKAGQTSSFWITFQVPVDAVPGTYRGKVTLKAGGKLLHEAPFTIRVWSFSLPENGHFTGVYDLRFQSKLWDIPGKTKAQVVEQFMAFMASKRLCPDKVPAKPHFKLKNGKVTADFTDYDKIAQLYFDKYKFKKSYTPEFFYLFGWAYAPYSKFGLKAYGDNFDYKKTDRHKLDPTYKNVYQQCLKLYWDHMKEKGWADKIVLYISDEPHMTHKVLLEQMQALCEMIHEVDKDIPIYSSTWVYYPELDGKLDIFGAGNFGGFPTEQMRKIVENKGRFWFTVDGQMCLDTPYCAIERLLPSYAFKYGAEAYEFWSVNWLTRNPFDYGWHKFIHQREKKGSKGYYVRYPNGDGYLAYPGGPLGEKRPLSSIRLEQAREGMEDYEYLYLLREKIKEARKAGKDTSSAEKALGSNGALVSIPNAGGRYSTVILPDPDAIFMAKEAIAKAIEDLDKKTK